MYPYGRVSQFTFCSSENPSKFFLHKIVVVHFLNQTCHPCLVLHFPNCHGVISSFVFASLVFFFLFVSQRLVLRTVKCVCVCYSFSLFFFPPVCQKLKFFFVWVHLPSHYKQDYTNEGRPLSLTRVRDLSQFCNAGKPLSCVMQLQYSRTFYLNSFDRYAVNIINELE